MNFEEKTITSNYVYNCNIINIKKDKVELSNGENSTRIVVEHPGGVVIVAQKTDDTILMVRQYRYPIKSDDLELPAGKLEKDEDPFFAAKRELEEETGYQANIWKDLGYIYTTPGFCNEKLYLYYAADLTFVGEHPDKNEIITSFEYKINDVFDMIKTGKINDSKTICALTRAFKL